MALALIQVPHGLGCHLPEGFLEALLHHRDLERESCYLGNPRNYDAPRRQVKSIRKTALTNPAWKRIDSRKTCDELHDLILRHGRKSSASWQGFSSAGSWERTHPACRVLDTQGTLEAGSVRSQGRNLRVLWVSTVKLVFGCG